MSERPRARLAILRRSRTLLVDEALREHQVTLLPLGTRFSAVRIPGRLLVALTGINEAPKLDRFLRETLDGGPVICDPRFRRYHALVPASMPRTWHQALDDWRAMDVDCLGRGSYLDVPRVDAVQWTRPRATYWSAPMDSPTALCSPVEVARLIAAGRHCMPAEPEV
ncbi:hypothetical protein ACIQXA_16270 [Streptomyces massasporeus]|uniref:hypothetical protein n=1 Tax=Streptomyces massasporeus TaxID=67324 RepID=UPI003810F797